MKKSFIVFVCMVTLILNVFAQNNALKMVKIPGANFEMLEHEVTVALYEQVMGERPVLTKRTIKVITDEETGEETEVETVEKEYVQEDEEYYEYPVVAVSAYDAIYFCNKLSELSGLEPVYTVNDESDVRKWDYTPHECYAITGKITQHSSRNGYRLPTVEEFQYAGKGGEEYSYPGSDDFNEVIWCKENSFITYHPVAGKKPNAYGLYDMVGNVYEWCFESTSLKRELGKGAAQVGLNLLSIVGKSNTTQKLPDETTIGNPFGGSYRSSSADSKLDSKMLQRSTFQSIDIGFRIVRTVE